MMLTKNIREISDTRIKSLELIGYRFAQFENHHGEEIIEEVSFDKSDFVDVVAICLDGRRLTICREASVYAANKAVEFIVGFSKIYIGE